jgi:hypothetical protein
VWDAPTRRRRDICGGPLELTTPPTCCGRAETRINVAEALAAEDPDRALALVGEALELARAKEAPVIERRAAEPLGRLGG